MLYQLGYEFRSRDDAVLIFIIINVYLLFTSEEDENCF